VFSLDILAQVGATLFVISTPSGSCEVRATWIHLTLSFDAVAMVRVILVRAIFLFLCLTLWLV
jgi:hypothetical protein